MEDFVPFPERARYAMLNQALTKSVHAKTLAKRLNWPIAKVRALVMDPSADVYVGDMAEWFFAVDGSMVHFEMVPRAVDKTDGEPDAADHG